MKNRIEDSKIFEIPTVKDNRGDLSFIENDSFLPFSVKRIFYMYAIPKDAERGGHAHKLLQEFMVCLNGSCDLHLDDGTNKKIIPLNSGSSGVYIPSMIWRDMKNFSEGCVCLVLASELYDEEDYYRHYNEFLKDV